MKTLGRRRFDAREDAPRSARRWVEGVLRERAQGRVGEAAVGDVLLMVSELATNALRYAGETFEIRIMITGHDLRVEVADSSAGVPQAQWVPAGATSGRGLAIVESLSDGWGVTAERGGGKAVWFELRAAGG